MYQSQAYGPQGYGRPGCFGCFAGINAAPVMPDPYAYNQYAQQAQYGPYPGATLTTSVVAPVGVGQVNPMAPMMAPNALEANGLYQSRTFMAPPIVNKAVVNAPASSSRVEYVPYEVKEIVYDTVEKVEVIPIHKTITQYQQLKHIETVPVEKMVTDYYAMEYLTEYMPQVVTDRVTDYVHQEVINETVNYVPREMQRMVPAGQYAPPVAPMMVPQMQSATFTQSMISPTVMPTVATVSPIDPSIRGSYVTPGLTMNASQQLMTSGQFGYGYGMGPTVGTVVGQMNQPGYGITAITN